MNKRNLQPRKGTFHSVLLVLLLSIIGMTNVIAQQPNQTKLTEYSFNNLGTIEERVFFLHSIQENDLFSYVLSDDEGKIDIYVSENYTSHESNANLDFDFFLESLYNEWTTYSNLDKIERGGLFVEWCYQLEDEVFLAINEDFVRQMSSVNSTCGGSLPFCTDIGSYEYPAGVNSGTGEQGPYYGCLYTQPNPAWYYMQIDQPGNLSIKMHTTPARDIDFVCWGPFNDMGNACSQLISSNVVSCSYSINNTEYCNINNAQTGQYYVLLITNYSNQPANIIFENIGTGSTMNFQGVSSIITATANPIDGGTVTGSGEYEFGSTCTLNATANDGYSFKYWTENGVVVSYDAEYTFAVTFDRNFVANFTPNYSVTVSANPEEGGFVSGNGVYELDSSCTVTATANEGFFFVNWTENGTVVSNDTTYTFTVVHESNLIANFVVEGTIIFDDANVKNLCVANWDADGDGELNQTEAAAVTSLDGVFMFDGDITSFNELQFFTGLSFLADDEFNSCTSLVAITIPGGVTSIGDYAFSDCSSLTSMTSYACTPPALGYEVFYNVPSVLVLNVPCHTSAMYLEADGWSDFSNYEEFEYGLCPIPFADATVKAICVAHWDTNEDGELSYAEAAAVTNLGTYFKSTAITSFDELEYFTSLTSLPNTAFYGCTSLASIALPASVSALGNGSFYNCTSLATMTVYAETPPTVGTNALKNVPIEMVVYVPCGTYAAYHTANGWSEFANIQEPGTCSIVFADANVKALCVANWDTDGDGELRYDEAAAVTDLGQVFRNNSSITSFDELQYFVSLTSIGNYAFVYCTGLTSVELPNSVTSIGNFAFQNCTGLTSVEIPNSVTSIDDYAFYNCTGLTSVEIPNSVTSIGTNPFSGCSGLEQIEVASDNAYYDSRENCNAIIRTSTNALVTGCKNTVIPNSVTSIGDYAFVYCTGLTSVEIPNSVTSIGNDAFYYCTGLTSVEIPNSVTSIGNSAFQNCTGLTSVEIPNSVTSIGNYAFNNCTNLNSVVSFAETPPTLGNYVFYNVNKSIPVYVPCGSSEAYQGTNRWNEFTNIMGMCPGTITVAALPTEGGSVTGGGSYEGGGATCTLTATANHDYCFLNWTENGEVVSSDAEYTFTVAGDRSLVANFSFMPPAPVVAEYYPDSNEPNSPYVKVHWAASLFEAQIGEGTSTFGYFPFYTLYNYSISENLFLASELEEAGVNTALMTSLSWYATNAPGYEQQGISIWMANVSDTGLTTTSHTVNDMTLVYTGAMTPEIGWNEFVFNEGNFAWDGVSNVLIYCQRNNGTWNNTVYWQATANLPFNASSYKYQDASAYNPNVAQSMTISTTRPNIIMKYEGQMIYNLYRANCDGTDAQLIAENLNDTQYIDETWWQLENNSYKYGVSIADSTSTDIFWSNCIEKQGDVAVQTIALSQGWNWVSLSIEAGDPVELLQMLETALVDNAVQIQSFDDNTEFDGEEWFGGLDDTGVSNEQMYMIEVVNDCTVELQGTPANPADYEIYIEPEQWTWIGYPCAVEQDIAAALADFEPEEGDQIQAGNIMTEFDGEEWFGDFETLVPGQGYMYFSNSSEPKILVFSTTAKGKSVILRKEKN